MAAVVEPGDGIILALERGEWESSAKATVRFVTEHVQHADIKVLGYSTVLREHIVVKAAKVAPDSGTRNQGLMAENAEWQSEPRR